ncbi:MAG: glycosyltransferase involved in cell wall biosynthesis [Candidatus Azotimanducaceae bacterium]
MRIAVNTRLLLKDRLEGIGNYANETLQRLVANHPEHTFIFLFDRPFDNRFVFGPNVTPVVLPLASRHPFLHLIWFNFLVPRYLKKHKADVFLSPDGYLSLNTTVPQIPIFHDLNFEHRPADLPFWDRWHYRRYFPKFAKKAKHIISVSEYTKTDIQTQYNIAESKISVVYNGVKESFAPCSDSQKQITQEKYSNGQPFIIYVGSIHARKNIERLIEAFALLHQNSPSRKIQLVLAGASMWKNSDLEQWMKNSEHAENIHCTGRLSDQDLKDLLPAAEMMVYVSLFEGFGVPIIEAQQAGIPVLCADNTSLPEVAGDAAILVDAEDIDAIAFGMDEILSKPELKQELIQKGFQNAKRFNWDTSAEQLGEIIAQYG